MYWLCLPLALAALCLAIVAAHAWLVAAGLLAMLALLAAWARGWYRSRLGAAADAPEPDIHAIIDPAELRRLRELAQARKQQPAPRRHDPA